MSGTIFVHEGSRLKHLATTIIKDNFAIFYSAIIVVVIVVSLIQIDEILWNFEVSNLKLDSFFWKKNDEDIFLEINIPRIRLEANVYNINSVFNDVDYNVEILSESNVDENSFFLAGHSGNGAANYFNDLFLLEVGDIILKVNSFEDYKTGMSNLVKVKLENNIELP